MTVDHIGGKPRPAEPAARTLRTPAGLSTPRVERTTRRQEWPISLAKRSRPAWNSWYLRRLVAGDIAIGAASSVLATALGPMDEVKGPYFLASAAIAVLWPLILAVLNGYDRRYLAVGTYEYSAVGRGVVVVLGLVGLVAVLGNALVSRSYVLLLIGLLALFGVLLRYGIRHHLQRFRRRGRLMQRTLIVGRPDSAAPLVRDLLHHPQHGLRPVACYTPVTNQRSSQDWSIDVPLVGPSEKITDTLDRTNAEVVVVVGTDDATGKELRRLGWALEERRVDLLVSTGVLDVAGPRLTVRPSENFSLLHIERPAATRAHMIYKEVIDRIMALALVVLLSPIFLAVAIAVKVSSRGPVLYRQIRIGEKFEPFEIFKFRTMVDGADKLQGSLHHLSEGNEVQFKLKQDPRVTPVGTFLRRYSLDELPQLFNVIRGEMSLVGPRPQSREEVDRYEPDAMRRLHVRPGMTGLWQTSGRSDLDWEQSLRLDLRYVDNWSPVVDLQILGRTLTTVLKGEGAY